MEKIIIDTNIYYSLIDISENKKVNKDQFINFEKFITTATLIECIIKYKNDLNTLKKIIKPLMEKKYQLIFIGYVPLDNNLLNEIYNANNINEISDKLDAILKMKILKESEFTRWFLYIIMPIIFDLLSEVDNYKFNDENQMKEFQKLTYSLLGGNIETILTDFSEKLIEGYEVENAQQIFTNTFYSIISTIFTVYLSNFYLMKEFDKKLKPAELGSKVAEYIKNDKFYKLVMKHKKENQNPFSFFEKEKYNEQFLKSLEILIKELNDNFYNKQLTESSIKFIEQKIYKIFTTKAKLYKNDIFDLLITMSLEPNIYKLLSLDKKFVSLIKEIDANSFHLIKELGLISR